MTVANRGAQRASISSIRLGLALALATLAILGGAASVTATTGAGIHVVVIVGPVASKTAEYIADAKRLAVQAGGYGATVTELYSPNATWSRVRTAAAGANVLIYLGHGNGRPSPYPSSEATQDGLGLNASAGNGNSNTRYYGASFVSQYLHLAPNAVVILNHLCYASGNNEWGMGNPTRSVAIQRVDNYGAGFLRAGASAVFAEGITDAGYILRNLFATGRTMRQIFWASPRAEHSYSFAFTSTHTTGARAEMDPYAPSRYYRSVIGKLDTTTADWR